MDTRCHPGPSLSPSTASKTPSRQADGEAAQLLTGRAGEGKDRVGEVRYYTCSHSGSQPERERLKNTDWQTEMQKGKGTQTPATKDRHRPLPTQLRYAHSQVYTHFPNSDTRLRHLQAYTNRHTQITNIYSTTPKHTQLRINIFPDSQGQIQFQSHTRVHIQCRHTQLIDPQIHVLRLPHPKTDKHTFNTDSQIYMS